MKRLHLAVIGLGKVGRACATAILDSSDLVLAGIVRRPQRVAEKLPGRLREVRVAGHLSELGPVDAALICVTPNAVLSVAHDILQHNIAVVECAELHGKSFEAHRLELVRMALRFAVPAIVGAGWDPGLLSLYRGFFAMQVPRGETHISRRPGTSLHHTTTARGIAGVKDALSTELRTSQGKMQHYVYVELEKGASAGHVERAVRADPLFLGEETLVFPVESVAELEQQGHGIYLERHGIVNGDHQRFILEGRFDLATVTARVMVAAAQALPFCEKGAYTLFDLPPVTLWGRAGPEVQQRWI